MAGRQRGAARARRAETRGCGCARLPHRPSAARVAAVEVASLLAISSGELPALVGGGAGGEARAAVLAEAAAPGAELEAEAGSKLEVVVLFAGRDGSPLALSSCAGLTPSSSS